MYLCSPVTESPETSQMSCPLKEGSHSSFKRLLPEAADVASSAKLHCQESFTEKIGRASTFICPEGFRCSFPPWLQPVLYYSLPNMTLQQDTALGVWAAAQGAFGTACGTAQQLLPLSLLLKEQLGFPALIPICRVSLKMTSEFTNIRNIHYARFLSGIAPFSFPNSCCHVVQIASVTKSIWEVTSPAERKLSGIK